MRNERRFLGTWLAALALVAGCRDVGMLPAPDASPAASKAPGAAKPSPKPSAGASDGPATALKASSQPAGVARELVRPAGAVRGLAGSVAIDAGYAAATTGGRIISNNGARILSANGASLISDAGATLISDAGGDAGGAELIGKIRGTTGMVAGASLIGKIRFAAGNDLIGKIRYELAQAEPSAAPATEVGTILPSAGMAVRVLDLGKGAFLPLGTDAAGQPAYEILSGPDGRFEAFLPADATGTVLIVARPPGSDDPRLLYQLVASAKGADEAVTEESSYCTDYIKLASTRAMFRWVSGAQGGSVDQGALSEADWKAVIAGREVLRVAGEQHTAKLPEAERAALAVRLAELLLARIDLQAIPIGRHTRLGPYEGPDEPAFKAFAAIMGSYRETVTGRFRTVAAVGQDPFAFYEGKPYFVRANEGRAEPYTLRKPIDFVSFIVDRFIANDDPLASMTDPDYFEIGREIPLGDWALFKRFDAALSGTKEALDRLLYVEQNGLLAELKAAIAAADPAAKP